MAIGVIFALQTPIRAQELTSLESAYSFAHQWFVSLTEKTCSRVNAHLYHVALAVIRGYFVESKKSFDFKDFETHVLARHVPCRRPVQELETLAGFFLSLKKELLEDSKNWQGEVPYAEFQKRIFLLQLLAEETLFASHWRGSKTLVFSKDLRNDPTDLNLSLGVQKISLNQFDFLDGDILLSKGDAGSSAFISRIGEWPSFYSHAAVLSYEPEDKIFYLPEAFIEDMVKRRSVFESYVPKNSEFGKRRLSAFRLKAQTESQMGEWTEGVLSFTRKIFKEPIPYDFVADMDDPSAQICFEVPDQIAKSLGVPRPYPPENSTQLSPTQWNFFSAMGQNVEKTFPVPSDIEKSIKGWEWVVFQLDLRRLGLDRVDSVLLDLFWKKVASVKYKSQFEKLFMRLAELPDNSAYEAWLRQKAKQEGIPLIDGLGWRQTLFFGLLDKWVVPEVQKWAGRTEIEFQKTSKFHRPRSWQEISHDLDGFVDPYVDKFLNFFEK